LMARHRFYATPEEISSGPVRLSADETYHFVKVLRLRPGDEVNIFDGRGREYNCRLLAIKDGSAQLEITEEVSGRVESPLRLTLAQALAKGEKFDLIVQKATELGVSRIVPLATDHTDVKLKEDRRANRLERWRRISLEALKQCGRRRLVEITAPMTVAELLAGLATGKGPVLQFSERGGAGVGDALKGTAIGSPVTVMIGPEGGWSDAELDLLRAHGAKAVTLGPRTLRTETAAIVAVALIQHALGDLSV
jgi:16S rRNA (uracil1498-N3)-methyltransferase